MLKREPALILTALVTILSAVLVALPDLGVALPEAVAKGLAGVIVLAGGFGIRSRVRPV